MGIRRLTLIYEQVRISISYLSFSTHFLMVGTRKVFVGKAIGYRQVEFDGETAKIEGTVASTCRRYDYDKMTQSIWGFLVVVMLVS